MPPVNCGQVAVDVGDGQEVHRQLVHGDVGTDPGDVIRVPLPINAQAGFGLTAARRLQRFERRQRAALGVQTPDNQKLADRRAGGLHFAHILLGRNAGINDLGMTDPKSRLLRGLPQGLAAKVKPVKSKRGNGIGDGVHPFCRFTINLRNAVIALYHPRRRLGVQWIASPGQLEAGPPEPWQSRPARTVPPSQPGVRAHVLGQPIIGHVINRRQPRMAQREDERLGKPQQAVDMDEIRLKSGNRFVQDVVIGHFQGTQLAHPGHRRVFINPIEQQTTLNRAARLFDIHAVLRGQDVHGMAARLQRIRERLDPEVKRPRVMRRIKIGEDQNFHNRPEQSMAAAPPVKPHPIALARGIHSAGAVVGQHAPIMLA